MLNANRKVYLLYRALLLGVLLLMSPHKAVAGALPMPLEAQLDMAKDVFIGQIIQIEKSDYRQGKGIRWGCAKVEVKKTLKGAPVESTEFYVAIGFDDPNYSRGAASPPKIYGVGRSGIWLIGANDVILHAFGLLNEDRKSDVQRILKSLSERKWSEPINGLRAWAVVVHPDYHDNPVIIFAVQNVSESNIYVPSESEHGFIKATAINERGESYGYVLGTTNEESDTVYCRNLPTGQIVYLHPQYSFIDLAWRQKLPPGKYSVIIHCDNTREGRMRVSPTKIGQVSSWKGNLQARPVELIVKSEKQKQDISQ